MCYVRVSENGVEMLILKEKEKLVRYADNYGVSGDVVMLMLDYPNVE